MKFLLLIMLFFVSFSFSNVDHNIIGIWQTKFKGITGTISYKQDSTFDVFINNKTFASGKYTYSDNTLTYVEDNGCVNQSGSSLKGVYKINFFAPDSIQFEAVYDSCGGRKRDLNHLKMGKVEKVSK